MNDIVKQVHADFVYNGMVKVAAGRSAIMNRREEVEDGRVRWLTCT